MTDIVLALRGAPTEHPAARPVHRAATTITPVPRAGETRDTRVERRLARQLGSDPRDVRAFVNSSFGPGPPGAEDTELRGEGSFAWRRGDRWQVVHVDPHPTSRHWWWTTAAAIVAVLGAIVGIAWFSARAIIRPLERLADAARDGTSGRPWTEQIEGPPEVIVVAEALAAFQREQADHVAQRTRMLSAIAHDLGTPLTRLAFRLEAIPEPQRETAFGEIDFMRRLIADTLALDRGASEPAHQLDLADLVSAMVCECQALGLPVELDRIEPAPVIASELALRRLVQNLIDNALRYGHGATLRLSTRGTFARFTIADRGPGFSPEMLEHGCKPFARGEASRNRETGGSGLGLAIAAAIAMQHRGSLELHNGEEGGGLVVVSLPLAGSASSGPCRTAG